MRAARRTRRGGRRARARRSREGRDVGPTRTRSSMYRLLLVQLAALGGAVGCKTDEDCSLNGNCAAGGFCQCHSGWKGAACSLLDRRPAASESAAAVYGMHPNVTSWGGNVLLDNSTGLHHLYVTEIAGPNGTSCGLISWGSHSTIVHAVSKSGIAGPFVKKSVAVGHEGHNPQTIRYKGQWVIFHIGSGGGTAGTVPPCPAPPPPPCGSYDSKPSCPTRCEWVGGACKAPPLPPTPPALCATQATVEGYSCTGDTCVNCHGSNCGSYLTVPNLSCTRDCATQLATLCDKDPRCHSFSLENRFGGKGALHSQTFAGNGSCLRPNRDWSSWVKNGSNAMESDQDQGAVVSSVRMELAGSTIHASATPDGPFLPVKTSFPHCNNPSPWVMKNGTIVVLCTWSIHAADALEGPWRTVVSTLSIDPSTRMGVPGSWEVG
eukprot:COSAG02_NODE_225_length_28184_cov_16.570981_7_plen_435_part_00